MGGSIRLVIPGCHPAVKSFLPGQDAKQPAAAQDAQHAQMSGAGSSTEHGVACSEPHGGRDAIPRLRGRGTVRGRAVELGAQRRRQHSRAAPPAHGGACRAGELRPVPFHCRDERREAVDLGTVSWVKTAIRT